MDLGTTFCTFSISLFWTKKDKNKITCFLYFSSFFNHPSRFFCFPSVSGSHFPSLDRTCFFFFFFIYLYSFLLCGANTNNNRNLGLRSGEVLEVIEVISLLLVSFRAFLEWELFMLFLTLTQTFCISQIMSDFIFRKCYLNINSSS